jgi:HlyD family secretion protein
LSSPASRTRRLGRGAFWLLLVLLAAAAAAWWWSRTRAEATPAFRTARVERGAITAVVSSSGTLNAVTTVLVGSQVSGQVKEIYADFNSTVKKDQLIARIDPESFELKVRQAMAEKEAAETNLLNQRNSVLVLQSQIIRARITREDALRELERKRSLVDKGFISVAERDKAQFTYDAAAEALNTAIAQLKVGESQVANAGAVLKQREAALAAARVDLERTAIRAPVDGVVISRNVDAGQTVAASLQAPTLFTIAQDLRAMQVDTAIDESDIGKIRLEQRATFTVDAFPGRTFQGTVAQIRKAAQTVQNVVTYIVVIRTENPELQLVPGMTANVRIVTDSRTNVLKVANAALRFRPPQAAGTSAPAPTAAAPAGAPAGPGAGGGGMGGPGDAQARRQRLVEELKLDSAQQARLDEIFAESRQRFMDLREAPEAERRTRGERIRAETRQKIAAMLNPEQQRQYADIVAQETGRLASGAGPGRVYLLEAGVPREIALRLGLSDGNSTEVVAGPLKEGDEVIVGNVERAGSSRPTPSSGSAPGPRLPF